MLEVSTSWFARSVGLLCLGGAGVCMLAAGCIVPSPSAFTGQEVEKLRRENLRLGQVVTQRDGLVAELEDQLENLRGVASDRPVDSYRPVDIQIASLSGGANYDEEPGDDGVTVHLRLRDADGDVVKAPGRILVQLLDTSAPGSPVAVGLCVFDDPSELGRMWHGRFGTGHFSLRCPFFAERTPKGRKLTINVEFVDYVTGKALTAVKEVAISPPDG